MLTKLDNYLNYTDVLEDSRIIDLLELAYEDGVAVEVLKTVNKNKEYCITFSLHSLVNVV